MLKKTPIELLCAKSRIGIRQSCRTELLLIKSSNYVLHHVYSNVPSIRADPIIRTVGNLR